MRRTLATDLFQEMVSRPPDRVNLAAAALLIALDEYPTLNVSAYLQQIDAIAERTLSRMLFHPGDNPLEAIQTINRQLFEVEGFRGNREDYYDPRNSFLNEVLERKKGIPITLSLLYMEVGLRIGLKVEGVGMPGHFIVKCEQNGNEIFVDPFERGAILLEEDCRRKLAQLHGSDFQFDRTFLGVFDSRQILARMLHNLKGIYWNAKDYTKALGIIDKVLLINPTAAVELRDRGYAHYQVNQLSLAISDWNRYLELKPTASDAAEVANSIKVAAQVLAIKN